MNGVGEGGKRREGKGERREGERREGEGGGRRWEKFKWERREGGYMCYIPHYVTTLSSILPHLHTITPSHPHTVLPSIA